MDAKITPLYQWKLAEVYNHGTRNELINGSHKQNRKPLLKKSFLIYDNDTKENTLIYAHHISYKKYVAFLPSLWTQ